MSRNVHNSTTPPRPSTAEWEAAKDIIRDYYITQNLTARKVMQKMDHDHHFHASERMFKARFQRWHFDCKTIKDALWNEMYTIYNNRRNLRGKDTVFHLYVSGEVKTVGIVQIQKHRARAKNSKVYRKKNQDLIQQSQLQYSTPPGSPNLLHQATPINIDKRSGQLPQNTSLSPDTTTPSFSSAECSNGSLHSTPEGRHYGSPSRLPEVPPPKVDQELDLTKIFAQMNLSIAYNDAVERSVAAYCGCSRRQERPIPLRQDEKLAGLWILNAFLTCYFHDRGNMQLADEHRRHALLLQQSLLRAANAQFLAGFLWVSSMVIAHGHDELILQFWNDCAQVIATLRHPNPRYAAIVAFSKAVFEGNQAEAERIGSSSAQDHEGFVAIWGENSPNALLSTYYHAWYLLQKKENDVALDQRNFDEGIRLMRHVLNRAESVMGKDLPVTINCLATLSRAHAERNQDHKAMVYLQEAIQQSQISWGRQHPFCLLLMRRLAMLQKKAGRLILAEQILREVVDGRVEQLRLSNPYTWAAIKDLAQVLEEMGQHHERMHMLASYDALYQRDGSILEPKAFSAARPW